MSAVEPSLSPEAPLLRDPSTPLWRDLLLLAVVTFSIWGLTCGWWDLRGPDEGRYTQIAKELLQKHNWLHLTVLDKPYDQKPPLAFWMFAAMLWLRDGVVSSAFVRLPSAVGATVCVLLVYLIGRKHWSRRAGLIAALMLSTSAGFVDDAPTVELNMLYTFCTTVAIYAWINRAAPDRMSAARVVLFWIGVVGAFFVKGPLSFLIIISALLWEAATYRAWRNLRLLHAYIGIPVTLALIAAWFYAEKTAFGKSFVSEQVEGETIGRLLHGAHAAPFWYYLPRLFTSTCPPWAFLLIPAAYLCWRQHKSLERPLPTVLGWLVPPFIVLCIANGKRNSYLTPLIPAMSLFNAWYIERSLAGRLAPKWLRVILTVLGAIAAVGLLAAAGYFAANPNRFAAEGFSISTRSIIVWVACAVGAALLGYKALRRVRLVEHAVYCLAAMLLIAAFVNLATLNPSLDRRFTTRPLADYLHPILNAHKESEVAAVGRVDEPEYHVYGNYKVRHIHTKAFDPTSTGMPNILVVSSRAAVNAHDKFIAAGYGEPFKLSVSKDNVLIYERKPAK